MLKIQINLCRLKTQINSNLSGIECDLILASIVDIDIFPLRLVHLLCSKQESWMVNNLKILLLLMGSKHENSLLINIKLILNLIITNIS